MTVRPPLTDEMLIPMLARINILARAREHAAAAGLLYAARRLVARSDRPDRAVLLARLNRLIEKNTTLLARTAELHALRVSFDDLLDETPQPRRSR